MKVVESIFDTITVLAHGSVLAEGSYSEVSVNPLVVEAYMGSAGKVELREHALRLASKDSATPID